MQLCREPAHLANSFYIRRLIRGASRLILFLVPNLCKATDLVSEAHE